MNLPDFIPNILGAVGGSGAMAWLAKVLLSRMLTQYDEKLDQLSQKLDLLPARFDVMSERISGAITRITVLEKLLEPVLGDARQLRIDLEQRHGHTQGMITQGFADIDAKMNKLRLDLHVAHDRIRGIVDQTELDIEKVQARGQIRRKSSSNS